MKEEESSKPNEEAPVKWTTRGWEQPENEPDNTPDSTALVDKEAETKAVAVPEPAATVLEHEVKERIQGLLVEGGAVFLNLKFAGNRGKR